MRLDHDTGEMDGRILAGRHAGRMLSELSLEELLEAGQDFSGDPDSSRLLEGYLDRAHPGWRDDVQADRARRQSAAAAPGGLSTQEAYEILGLEPGAGEAEVREAHRRLMKQVHPDRGGSAALAARINEAKERILGQYR
jgi:DnaJ-domain-containing protein 1